MKMSNIWFVSDTHHSHKNICIGVSEWDDKAKSCRNFQTLEEMNELIVNNINKYVKEDDILYHLGDWSFGGIENIWKFRKQIKCKNIYLVPGNHDHHIKNDKVLPNCKWGHHYEYFEDWYPTEEEPTMEDEPVKATEIFTAVLPELTKIVIDKKEIILSHFPLEEWENMDRGSWMLHGHCHGKFNQSELNLKYKRMDVGLDTNNLKPYSINDIFEIMNNRNIKYHNT